MVANGETTVDQIIDGDVSMAGLRVIQMPRPTSQNAVSENPMKGIAMKSLLFATALAVSVIPAFAADVGVSLSIGQPGFYGRLDIGDYPSPQVIYQRPRLMYRQAVQRPPIYLHVPENHARNWRYHCRQYNACKERVYFVQDNWYQRDYVPHYQEHHAERPNDRHDDRRNERGNDRRWKQNKHRDNSRDHGRDR